MIKENIKMLKLQIMKNKWKKDLSLMIMSSLLFFSTIGCSDAKISPEFETKIQNKEISLSSNPRNTGIHWVNNWPTTGECSMKKGSNIPYSDDTAKYWQDEMREYGWSKENSFGDDSVWGKDFVEDQFSSTLTGSDHRYFDDARAALLNTHGGLDYAYNWEGSLRTNHDGYGCDIKSKHMRLGEPAGGKYGNNPGRLDFFHNLGCWSATRGYTKRTWGDVFQGIHFITGYDKISWDSWWNNDDLEDFAYWAHDHWFSNADEMSYVWIDQLLHWNSVGEDDDACPVAITVDENTTMARKRLYGEKYKSNWSDIPKSKWTSTRTRYWSNCVPAS